MANLPILKNGVPVASPAAETLVKFSKPKILLIDTPESCLRLLRKAGLLVQQGTFGSPYPTPDRHERLQPVFDLAKLPNHTEQEVIVIDQTEPPTKPLVSAHLIGYTGNFGTSVNPRALSMFQVHWDFDRIYEHGGIFIIFAGPRDILTVGQDETYEVDTYNFLTLLTRSRLTVTSDSGTEIFPASKGSTSLERLIGKHLEGAKFFACFEGISTLRDRTIPLAISKFKENVAVAISPVKDQGLILLLPHVQNKSEFLRSLIIDVLPELRPSMFPEFEGKTWTSRAAYELPKIRELMQDIQKEEDAHQARINILQTEIAAVRASEQFMHDFITETDDNLVLACKSMLELLGFAHVELVDAGKSKSNNFVDEKFDKDQPDKEDSLSNFQEDLQIEEGAPLPLIVAEVKGIGDDPDEKQTSQVHKYVTRRVKQLKRTDIRGLVIINQKRHLPPLDRKNDECYTLAQVNDAKNFDVTLATTWDILLLFRGAESNGWHLDTIKSLFYQKGRISSTPAHYQKVGKVDHIYTKVAVVAVVIEVEHLNVGDTLAIVSETNFIEFRLESIHLNEKPFDKASRGDRVGIKVSSKTKINEKQIIWRVQRDWSWDRSAN